MKKRRILTFSLVGLLALAGFLVIRGGAAARSTAADDIDLGLVERGALEVTINAAGTLASPQSAALSWEAAGVVASLPVEVGDSVHAGQVLSELDPSTLDAGVIQAAADLARAERDREELLNSNLPLAQAQQAGADARDALRVAQYNHDVQQEGRRATAEAIELAKANLLLAEDRVEEAEDAYNGARGDLARANTLTRLAAAKADYRSALATYNWYTGHPTDLQQAMLEADLAVSQATLEDAERTYERLLNGPDAVEVAAAEARIAKAKATLAAVRITAPFDATVVSISVRPGDVVEDGTVAVTLANLQTLEVEVDVSEVDVNQIAVGQEARLTLDAAPDRTFSGVVSQVTLAGEVSQGVVTFPVTVEIADPDPALKPGMTAAVTIVTERVENVLLVPNRAVQAQSEQRTVVVMFEGQQISVPVTLGLSNESMSEVLEGGLQEGDSLVLNATAASASLVQGGRTFFGPLGP